jgi:competence protein CoiA-like protein
MLVAYGPDGRPVVAGEVPLEQLQRWSQERLLYCPGCRKVVHVRGGPEKRAQLHFAHQRGECPWSTESETVRHMRGKMVLAEWLREQFPQASVSLEERLPEPNRIADIFVTHANGQRWAIEYQCAPLDSDEWQHRHTAYRKANIQDTWIVGNNRRQKQEAFIEAIIASAYEVMFLDPLVTPPRVWLHWAVTRETVREWQAETGWTPSLEGWIGRFRSGYGATLAGQLQDVRLGVNCKLIHPDRSALEARIDLLRTMKNARSIDEATLNAYLCPIVGAEVLHVVLFPTVHAYLRDPDLLRRYNYGRGYGNHPVGDADKRRVQQARAWLERLSLQGFPPSRLEALAKEIPLVGPYAAFANFVEMLAFLSRSETNRQG